ncbi:MAG: methyltransferase [Pacificimonas sp.]|jgi:predicted methyltransferase|nr:methyltransferase [Pacificimonas sp.]
MRTAFALCAASALALSACAADDSVQDEMAEDDMAPAAMMDDSDEMAAMGPDYDAILASDFRGEGNAGRDQYRNPAETLDFFGLEPGMTVVEFWPGGGWYSEIIAPALGPDGRLVALWPAGERGDAGKASYQERFAGQEGFATVESISLGEDSPLPEAEMGAADMVLTFRNVHNFQMNDVTEDYMTAAYDLLKPGGILGIVDHRLPEEADSAREMDSGYIKRSTVKAAAEAAGFQYVGESEINANPNDTADHERGVWTLPPSLAMGDEDRERYMAIGESDRLTMKFMKPTA